ncbi:mediator of DNA damage checkpoint protein 1 isoform 2-T4 [Anomaloglossus baeobatrachus]|uniref:mediator of DNA damage checkpoint protein 1 isoform X2 n=1 Tax=Anomaloglossus baeobatrachus TaxID=238106 RepID=UPI003F50073B
MDATQRLENYSVNEEETSTNRDRPVGNLHMFGGNHGLAQDFSIYRGQNLIGRHASCDITLPAQSVSKKHAILEVRGDCHTICDNGSLNKTRRGKTALAPQVHYALNSGDFLLFADVACRYTIEENLAAGTTGVAESEDDSVLVPGTQGALAIEKTPGAAIRRIARGAVLARDSGDEEDHEAGQSRRNDLGSGSFKDSHKTSGSGILFTPGAETIVPESDEENETSTSETHLPSLNLQCDSDTDTSRRSSSFVPSSQNISTPSVLKEQPKHEEKTITVDQEEKESEKSTKLRLATDDTNEYKGKQVERKVEPLPGGGTLEPCVETVNDKLKAERERARMMPDDAIKSSSSESAQVSTPCLQEDNVTSSRSETSQVDPRERNLEIDALVHNKHLGTDVKQKEDNVGLDGEGNTKESNTTMSEKDVTSEIQTKTEDGNGISSGPGETDFYMDSDTDDDEPTATGSDLEKTNPPPSVDIEKSDIDANLDLSKDDFDSDTDVEGDQNMIEPKTNNDDEVEKMMDEPSKTEERAVLGMDSDTDVDDDLHKPAENKTDLEDEKKEGFHLDSDTDVEEDVSTEDVKKAPPESPKKESNLDSDTDVDEEVDIPGTDVTQGPQHSAVESPKVEKASGMDSDTDVDEDDPVPEVSSATLEKATTDEPKDKTALSDVVMAAALHVDSDTDDDGSPVAPELDKLSPQSTMNTEGDKKDTETTNEAAEPHLDSDTDVEEGDGSSAVSRQETAKAEEDQVNTGGIQEEAIVSSVTEIDAVCGTTAEKMKSDPAKIITEEEETQKSESESIDLETMATQCYLEPQEESDLQASEEEEEATQAFILSSTWAEPDPFKRPADPIGVLQISSVTVNTSEDEFDEDAIAETQPFCTEAESVGPSVQATPEPVQSVTETIQSSSGEEDVQQLSHETMSLDATQPVSQCLSERPSEETGAWLQLKREVPASVWVKGIQQEGKSEDLAGGNENSAQADEQSLKLELEATQSYVEEGPAVQKPPEQTLTPTDDQNKESDVPSETIEQPQEDNTPATDNDATQAYSLDIPDSDNGTAQVTSLSEETTGDGDSHPPRATEDENTQPVKPSVTDTEDVAPETSTESNKKPSSRRGLSRSKKIEPENLVLTPPEKEEQPEKASAGPDSKKEKPDEEREPQPSEPEIKEMQAEKGVKRRGGRRTEQSQVETTAKEEVPVVTTSRRGTLKNSSEDEPSSSGMNEQRGRKPASRKSAKKVTNEEEPKQPTSKFEEVKESVATEILPVNLPEEIESPTEDNKDIAILTTSKEACDQASLENKEIVCPESSTLSPVIEINEPNDNSAEKESESHQVSKKRPARNKRLGAARLKNEAQSIDIAEKDQDDNKDDPVTIQEKNKSKQSEKITQEESQGRKATRQSRVKPPELDKDEDTTASIPVEIKKVEEVCPPDDDTLSRNEKSRRTRSRLIVETKEEPENIQEGEKRTRRSASVKTTKPKNKENKQNQEDMSANNKTLKSTRNKSKEDTTKPEEVKIEKQAAVKQTRQKRNLKEEQKTEEKAESQETSTNDSQISRRSRKENRGEVKVVKEETVKETTTSRRTRGHSKEEVVTLQEDQTKRPKNTSKDSKEEAKINETVESFREEETVEKKTTRKTRKNLKDDKSESKETEDNPKPERSTRTRAKVSNESRESQEELEVNKTAEEIGKVSPHEEKSQPAVGRGRRAAKKDIPQISTPVSSRKRGQATIAEEDEGKRKKSDTEEEQAELGTVETPKSRRGRPRKLIPESENVQTVKEISPPDPSPSRSTRQRTSSALSNTPEAKTPRRTNRTSTLVAATSPYVAQSGSAPKILFTGVVDTEGEEAICSLGGEIADSVFDCTHLVTDRVRRTVKFLCALARGIPIVTLEWIDKCKKSGCFLSPSGFLVNDKEQEKSFNFTLSKSLQKAKKHPLLEGYDIHVTANVKPEPDHMKDIIRCSGATFLPKMPRSFKEKCIVVSCPEDAARCKSVPASVPITSAEFILSGILRQEVNPSAYLLNPAAPDTGPSPAKRRR